MSLQNKKTIAIALNKLLATEFVLYTKTLNFHWNIVGKWFGPLHKLFDDQYNQLQSTIDLIAERVRALEFPALGTLTEYIQQSSIEESPNNYPDDSTMLKILLNDHEIVIGLLRNINELTKANNDAGTENMSGELIEMHEKIAWMIRSHLQ